MHSYHYLGVRADMGGAPAPTAVSTYSLAQEVLTGFMEEVIAAMAR